MVIGLGRATSLAWTVLLASVISVPAILTLAKEGRSDSWFEEGSLMRA